MKRILFNTILVLFLQLGQLGTLEHAYHEHSVDDVCEYCLSASSLEHAVASGFITAFSNDTPAQSFIARSSLNPTVYVVTLSARAPPFTA